MTTIDKRPPGGAWRVAFDGASLNNSPVGGPTFPELVMAGRGIGFTNGIFVNNTELDVLTADIATRVAPQFRYTTRTLVSLCAGTSDIWADLDAATIYARFVTHAEALVAAGDDVVVLTYTVPPNGVNTGAEEAVRVALNELLVEDADAAFTAVVDLRPLDAIWGDGSDTDWFSDTIHFTAAAAQLVANVAAPHFDGILI